MDINESTSYLKIEVLSDTIEGNVRIIHRRKICTGNPMETFTTDEVIRIDVKETPEIEPVKVTTTKANTKRVRNRNAKGHYVADDPNTPENEAWKVIEIPPEITSKKETYSRKKRKRKMSSKKE